MRRFSRYLVLVTMALLIGISTGEAVPTSRTVYYQAELRDSLGNPIDTTIQMIFNIYDDALAGSSQWNETQPSVAVVAGVFSVYLGEVNNLSPSVFAGQDNRYLGIQVGGDPEMSPRSIIASVPSAMRAGIADDVVDTSITSSKIRGKSVTRDKLNDKAVGRGQVGDTAIGNGQLGDKAVGQDKIRDKAVGRGQVGDTAIGHGQLGDKAVGQDKIKDKAVGRGQLGDTAVGNSQIGNGAINSAKIQDGTIDFADIGQNGAASGQVMKWTGSAWSVASDDVGLTDGDWTISGNVLYTASQFGIARDGATLFGQHDSTHVNLGVASATGESGQDYKYATVGGGLNNDAREDSSTVAGGAHNDALAVAAFIGGGTFNQVNQNYGTVAGGNDNWVGGAGGSYSSIGGGSQNQITGSGAGGAVIAGGMDNWILAGASAIGGGSENRINAGAGSSTISGGTGNFIDAIGSTIGGGSLDTATGMYSTVGGGSRNRAAGQYATIGGGERGSAQGSHSTISGGYWNKTENDFATISGGQSNLVQGSAATIGGGQSNSIFSAANYAAIGGGSLNDIWGEHGVIGGGTGNQVTGVYGTVPGGYGNEAAGNYSFAAGQDASAADDNSFVWSSGSAGAISSVISGQFVVQADKFWFGNTSAVSYATNRLISTSTGAYLSNSGTWQSVSDADRKENFAPIDGEQLLEQINQLPISKWNYKDDPEANQHIGPTAQDFRATFQVGEDDKTISALDPAGVALAGIQELYRQNRELKDEVAQLKALVEKLAKNSLASANASENK